MARINFLNIEVDNLTMDEALSKINFLIQTKEPSFVVTPNMDHIVKIETDKEFSNLYKKADLILTDGQPLIWISKFLKRPIKEKISGSDLFPNICELASKNNYKIFILGAKEGVAERAGVNLKEKFNNLNIVGTYSPPFNFEKSEKELRIINKKIKESKPDILAVALGSPKGEKFIYEHLYEYNIPLSISIGATIDFEAGEIKRAPRIISKMGFEWLFRITQDPKRLSKRYINDIVKIGPIIKKYGKK